MTPYHERAGVSLYHGDCLEVMASLAPASFAAIITDPPYGGGAGRQMGIYANDSGTVADDVRAWCLERGDDPKMRIALCGYEGEHEALESAGWSAVAWKAHGGRGNQGDGRGRANKHRERIWFSPACVPAVDADDAPLMLKGMAASC